MKNSHKLNLTDSISIVAGSMIGSGIFIVSADIARQVQSGLALLLVWAIAGLVTLTGSISFMELAGNITDDGGQYIYLKKIYNDKVAFLFGWTTFLVIQTGTIAAVCTAFAKFIGLLIPAISASNVINISGYPLSTQKIFTILAVIILTYINSRGLKDGVFTQNLFTFTKVIALIGIILTGLFFGCNTHTYLQNLTMPISFDIHMMTALAVATVGALFAAITWNHITFVSKDVENREHNVPKAMLIGSLLVIALYFLINNIYIGTMPLNLIQNAPEDIVAAQLMSVMFGDIGRIVIAVVIMISAFGCANGMILAGARVYHTMAKNKAFFSFLAQYNEKTQVPTNSLWLQCFWISVLVLWGNYSQLLDYVIYTTLIFYWITVFGIFIYRKQVGVQNLRYKVPAIIPYIFLILTGIIIVCLTIFKPAYTVPGLLISLMGLPVFYVWQRK